MAKTEEMWKNSRIDFDNSNVNERKDNNQHTSENSSQISTHMHTNCKNISEIDYRNTKWSKPFQCSIFWLRLSCCWNQTGFSYFTLLSVVWSRKQVQLHIPTPHISDQTKQNVCDTHDTLIQTHKFIYIFGRSFSANNNNSQCGKVNLHKTILFNMRHSQIYAQSICSPQSIPILECWILFLL